MAELTAAEKAQLRRQKILAKKKARMAFVVEGDRSQMDSTATPSEPSAVDVNSTSLAPEPSASLSPSSTSETPTTTTTSSSVHQQLSPSDAPFSFQRPSPTFLPTEPQTYPQSITPLPIAFRLVILTIAAIAFAISAPPLSVVESFICLRVILALPDLMLARQQNRQRAAWRWSLLDIAARLPPLFSAIHKTWQEFAVYFTITLLTLSLMRSNS